MTLPTFKYHPDPVITGNIKPSETTCECCGKQRGYIYVGPVFSVEELNESICPWCIADGSAHEKFDAEFTDAAGVGGYFESPVVPQHMPKMTINFSRYLAIALGIGTPIVETIRRWHQLNEISNWPFWLDDFFLGGFLLYGAWRTRKNIASGQKHLAAAWAFACGMIYPSFFTQLTSLSQPDPSSLPSVWVAVIKGIGFALAIAALISTLRWKPADS